VSASQQRLQAALPPLPQGHGQNRPPTYAAEKAPDEQRIVALLAEESEVPVADVARLYANEHAKLAIGAHITKFLHIFATRNVQEILRKRRVQSLSMPAGARPDARGLPMPPGLIEAVRPLGPLGGLGPLGQGSAGSPALPGSGWTAMPQVAVLPLRP